MFIAERPWRWLHLRLAGKWHVDELYEETVVKPLEWTSRVLLYEGLDKRVIDGGVNLVGWAARSVGFLGQLFQSGNIQRYLAIFAVALAILLYGWLTPSHLPAASTLTAPVAAPLDGPAMLPRPAGPPPGVQILIPRGQIPSPGNMAVRPMKVPPAAAPAAPAPKAPPAGGKP